MSDDLFDSIMSDAGKGLGRTRGARCCSQCGDPLVDGQRAAERCLRCAWSGAGEARIPWKSSPGDASVLGGYAPRTPPYAHQLSALVGLRGDVRALLMEMGTGKTKVLIDDWAMRVEAGEIRDLVVIAPKGVYRNWEGMRPSGVPGELGIHLPEEMLERTLIATWISGGSKTAHDRLARVLANTDRRRPRVLLVNVEALSVVDAASDAMAAILVDRRAVLVVDESTRIRSHDAARTKATLRVGSIVDPQLKRIATGLPTPRSPLDLYSQFEFLDWRILGFRSFFGFRARHAVTRKIPVGPPVRQHSGLITRRLQEVVVGFRNVTELRDKIADHSFRVMKDECLDLPPKIYEMRHIELTDEQRRVYHEVRLRAASQLDDGAYVTATEMLPRLIRMQQILCGFVIDEEGVEHTVPSRRLDDLVELLGDTDAKAIVWAPYVRSLREISSRLRREFGDESTVGFWGEIRDGARLEAVERFQRDRGTRFFVGNPATGGMGITLTAASVVVYYANSPDLEHRLQSEDRAHRAGLTHKVTYVDLCARGTIDERWIAALRRKLDLASLLTGDGARDWLV